MSLTLRHLQTFQTIVDEGSFVRAAEKLNYSQATMTLQIQQLEEEIGMELFQRENRRRLQLTEAGRLFSRFSLSRCILKHSSRLCQRLIP